MNIFRMSKWPAFGKVVCPILKTKITDITIMKTIPYPK